MSARTTVKAEPRPRVEHSNHDLHLDVSGVNSATRRMELIGVKAELMSNGNVRLDIPVRDDDDEAHRKAVRLFREMGLDKFEAELAYARLDDALIAKALQLCVV